MRNQTYKWDIIRYHTFQGMYVHVMPILVEFRLCDWDILHGLIVEDIMQFLSGDELNLLKVFSLIEFSEPLLTITLYSIITL